MWSIQNKIRTEVSEVSNQTLICLLNSEIMRWLSFPKCVSLSIYPSLTHLGIVSWTNLVLNYFSLNCFFFFKKLFNWYAHHLFHVKQDTSISIIFHKKAADITLLTKHRDNRNRVLLSLVRNGGAALEIVDFLNDLDGEGTVGQFYSFFPIKAWINQNYLVSRTI